MNAGGGSKSNAIALRNIYEWLLIWRQFFEKKVTKKFCKNLNEFQLDFRLVCMKAFEVKIKKKHLK